jgi:hypothetical protein
VVDSDILFAALIEQFFSKIIIQTFTKLTFTKLTYSHALMLANGTFYLILVKIYYIFANKYVFFIL